MIAADSSVVIAAFAHWHEAHESALEAITSGVLLPAHVALETYAALTRLPEPHRARPEHVAEFIADTFPEPVLTLRGRSYHRLVHDASSMGIIGGAIYDAVIALTVKEAGATLVTRDRRAIRTYELIGARFDVIE